MKKKLALALAAVMIIGLFAGCSGNSSSSSAGSSTGSQSQGGNSASQAEELNVGVFYYNFADIYITSVRNNMDAKLKEMGVKYTNYDGANTQPTQTDQVNTAIANGVNLLIVNIVETSSPDAAQKICDAAKAADIPVIFFNREVADEVVNSYEKCAFVGTDAAEAGHMQGDMIAEYLLANYDTVDLNGDGVISYVMFKGQEGNAEAEFRTEFAVTDCNEALVAAGKPELSFYAADNTSKYLVDTTGAWSAQAATDYMNTILAQYSEANGNMVELVIANNDGMAEGAIAALQPAGYNLGEEGGKMIPVFGVDATDSAKEKINAGQMTGTIKQDAEGMANTIAALVGNVQSGSDLMTSIDSANGYNVDESVDKVRVPYGIYTGEE
ncbi:galactose ABC transporter substrate-binding protein [Flavonifractor sp. An100]|uniref:galactose ABC transporter substrate-binding protein n=1 Tax=Flavonifractor sp. An100 TaxID=1965538 RepID=UPI000B3956E8|nr:galactose ABC transporter substrate-binding protein [Flavonifractor sp. An100]OUQ78942.1 LacI family transcriptional regulator [Flavonifractor sp. An100]